MLTNKRKVFLEEYFKSWNAAEAARRAGYACPETQGPRLLLNVEIQKKIKERIEANGIKADEVIWRLAEQARNAGMEYLNENGEIELKQLVKDRKKYLVKRIKKTRYGKQVEFMDPQAALEMLGRHLKLFTERHEVLAKLKLEGMEEVLDRIYGPTTKGADERQ